ncbi:MAG: adenosine deaminase [Chloroflexi bacterium]|nr:adenosine deaminase [Chloroflexota bacterium]MCL5076365.1 adenosine deaminase [Chloroflexota bacterium]
MTVLNREMIQRLPKAELHLHSVGALRLTTIKELLRQRGLPLSDAFEEWQGSSEMRLPLAAYLSRIDMAFAVMQDAESLERISYELIEDLAKQNVIYAEVKFAPQSCTRGGLSYQEALRAVANGLTRAEKNFGLKSGLILVCRRDEPPELSTEIVKLAIANQGINKVVGVDLAGDETGYPGYPHREAFRRAYDAGLHRTVHAGEGAGPESIREALDILYAERLGHGVRLAEDPLLLREVGDKGVTLEMCPTSNVQTGAAESLSQHPIDRFLAQGLAVTVNTDDPTVAGTDLTHEYELLVEEFGWGLPEIKKTVLNALNGAFLSEPERKAILTVFEERWNEVVNKSNTI